MWANWGDVPTWIASLGTVGALTAAVWQIGNERQRRITLESELRQEQRRSQARNIAAWLGAAETHSPPKPFPIRLVNGSLEPVYRVFVCAVFIQGAAPMTTEAWLKLPSKHYAAPVVMVPILPPGKWVVQLDRYMDSPLQGRLGAEVAFSDRSGVSWVRRAMGELEELPTNPVEYYSSMGLNPPYDWRTAMPDSN